MITHHEDITRIWNFTALSEDLQDVPKLPVNVPADCHGGLHSVHIGLFEQNVPDAGTQRFHLSFWEVLALSDLKDRRR